MKRKVNVILMYGFDILTLWKSLNLRFILGLCLQMGYEHHIKTPYLNISTPRFASLAILHNTELKVVKQLLLQHFITSYISFYNQ